MHPGDIGHVVIGLILGSPRDVEVGLHALAESQTPQFAAQGTAVAG